jgi:hypothetical protein
MRKVRKVPKVGTKALLSSLFIRLIADSVKDTPKHQIPLLKTAEDYLWYHISAQKTGGGMLHNDWQFNNDAGSTRLVRGVDG